MSLKYINVKLLNDCFLALKKCLPKKKIKVYIAAVASLSSNHKKAEEALFIGLMYPDSLRSCRHPGFPLSLN